ncbi:hypothetical protein CEP88_18490 [Roseobacter denitrificans]|nr:hypothetical protein CEP88_18490 [Roseobacter denitrificans]SFG00028.1 hypothetical protein SAMN05443635_105180 [Roseobacter denitrificans OCh 114]
MITHLLRGLFHYALIWRHNKPGNAATGRARLIAKGVGPWVFVTVQHPGLLLWYKVTKTSRSAQVICIRQTDALHDHDAPAWTVANR